MAQEEILKSSFGGSKLKKINNTNFFLSNRSILHGFQSINPIKFSMSVNSVNMSHGVPIFTENDGKEVPRHLVELRNRTIDRV